MAINKNVLAEKQATVLSEDGNTMYATIQMRHGKEADMDKSKFVPAEMGVATDTKKAFMAFAPGEVKEIMFREDSEIEELLEEVRDISDQAVESVESAEATAKQAIEDYTEQMKATIPEDYTEMVKKVDMLERTKAPAIYQTVSGESLQIEDSADTPMAGLRVFGKSRQVKTTGAQLFDASKIPTKTQGGATVTNNGDGSFTVTGNGTVSELFVVNYDITGDIAKSFFKAGRVKTALSNVRPNFYFSFRHSGGIYGDVDSKSYTNFDLTDEMINSDGFYVRCGFQLPQGNEIVNGTIKPMVYQDGDGTWEPYTGGKPSPSPDYPQDIEIPGSEGSVGVNVTGNQLLDIRNKIQSNNTGVSVSVDGKGGITVNGTITKDAADIYLAGNYNSSNIVFPADTYTLSCDGATSDEIMFFVKGTSGHSSAGNSYLTTTNDITGIFIRLLKGKTYTNFKMYPMLNKGSTTLPFEPYKCTSISISTPNGLPGIPVDSGGNYTDADGQQWVCDEVDFERGKYVQRVKYAHIDSSVESKVIQITNNIFSLPLLSINMPKAFLGNYDSITQHEFCSKFTEIELSSIVSTKKENVFIFQGDNAYFRVKENTTIQEFKDILALGIDSIYPIETPVETDLSPEELAAYAALTTYYPTTNITTDSDPEAGIEAEYVVDTKKYIDSKFAELAQNMAATQNTLLEV